jgi:predicted ester cyclase
MRKLTIAAVAALTLSIAGCGDQAAKKDDTKTAKKDGDEKAKDGDKDKDKDGDKGKDGDGDKAAAADPVENLLAGMKEWNAGDFDASLARFSDDVKITFVGAPESFDKAGLRKQWDDGKVAFPDQQIAASRLFLSGDVLAVQFVSNGTHKGEFMGTAPTDKPVGNHILWVMKSQDGKISEVTGFANGMAEFSQIGAAPEGMPPVPVPEMPSGAPEIVKGEANDANVEVIKNWHATFAAGTTVEKLPEFLAEDGKHHNTSEGKTEDAAAAKANIEGMLKAFTDVKFEPGIYASAGDYVLATGKWGAKHVGDMGPIKATNKEFMIDFAEISLVKDGKIQESWGYDNPMQMMGQLGLLPPPPGTEEAVAAK